jgi:hypothetical protein
VESAGWTGLRFGLSELQSEVHWLLIAHLIYDIYCGVSCGSQFFPHDFHVIGILDSIWTVDLAHLLRHFAVDVAFLTVTIGANPNFAVETFYKVGVPIIDFCTP